MLIYNFKVSGWLPVQDSLALYFQDSLALLVLMVLVFLYSL